MDTPRPRYYLVYPTGTSNHDYTWIAYDFDPYFDRRAHHDKMLHETLTEIFQKHCHSRNSKIKRLLRRHNSERKCILKLIVKQRPALAKILSQKTKLPLLWIAVMRCYQKSAELLVRSGADVNERCESKLDNFVDKKTTILHILLQMFPSPWNERFITLVMDKGAYLQTRDSRGQTVLHLAVIHGRVEITKSLLEKGVDVNVADIDGETSLLAAAINRKADELVPLLVKYGADVTVKDRYTDMNALHLLAMAPYVDPANAARLLIQQGVSVKDRECYHNYQPVHMAALEGKNELVKLFLDHGSNVDARAHVGITPLQLAAGCNNPTVLMTLIKRGAKIDLRNLRRRTALHKALEMAYRNWDISNRGENFKILISAGADVCVEDKIGHTPFSVTRNLSDNHDYRTNIENVLRFPYNSEIWHVVLETLALKKACLHPSIKLKDEQHIKKSRYYWNYYLDCHDEINRLKSTRFFRSCTLFDLLTKCHCQIAALMWDVEFKNKFNQCDLNVFPAYARDIRRTFERAERHYLSMVEHHDVIDEAVYNSLPYVILRKVIEYICDECVLNNIFQDTRTRNLDLI